MCDNVQIATDTGRVGHHGFVTDLLDPEQFDVVYTCCGPEIMMGKRARMRPLPKGGGCMSKEAKMACGLVRLGCTCKSKTAACPCVQGRPRVRGECVLWLICA